MSSHRAIFIYHEYNKYIELVVMFMSCDLAMPYDNHRVNEVSWLEVKGGFVC
jgi:hypothetical protein